MTTTFSSAQMRDRDKLLEEKHKKELEAVERKVERLRRACDNAEKEIFNLRNQGSQLAQSLGFFDIGEAQRALDVSDYESTFRQAFERVQILGDEVRVERREKELFQARCQELEEQLAGSRQRSSASEKAEKRLQAELRDMSQQFDSIKSSMERAAQWYKRDRRLWFKIYHWLCLEPVSKKGKQIQEMDFDRLQDKTSQRRREVLREFGPALTELLGIDVPALEEAMRDAEDATDVVATNDKDADPFFTQNARGTEQNSSTVVGTPLSSDSNSKLRLASNRQPLSPLPITNFVKQETIEMPKPFRVYEAIIPSNSSDTEDDSQAPSQSFQVPLLPPMVSAQGIAGSSDTEDDSQAPNFFMSSPDHPPITSPFSAIKPVVKRFMQPTLPSRPAIDHTRRCIEIGTSGLRFHIKPEPEDDSSILLDERPAKKPRVSLDSIIKTPQATKPNLSPRRRVLSTGQVMKDRKRYEDENTPVGKAMSTVRIAGQTRLDEYAIYKGRGRYGKEKETTKTINALFTINPERNGGANHQYEEVVRDKEGRIRMDAGDCEECRDWYASIGPMPPRDRGPLWRSPSTTPIRPCKHHGAGTASSSHDHDDRERSPSPLDRRQEDIETHKKQISRHRQNWARAKTPPGYWNIGFPDTQETNEINRRAEEMHQQKLRQVEREADRGKWIRR
ncbi:hypothetical protein P691DRAFT_778588 [Macrolepiota fuliginosa MF-IS2]|uniref:DNA endonuclease activator Ctp1 C-terminal domain-containing protein n=1 Tax=Macrolepiota fuliginosa MF-IS2 TaxID=1400762 RepID=A0A9P6BXE0_9AGAR|nr:hypothetical protein P691DRAFT_778588 [Macrolepiota fuliginosa MF-IS2]